MAALSPAHFLLWARLTTASPAPSVTPSEGTNRWTSVGVFSSTCPRRKSYLSVPPFSWTTSVCVCVCVCVCFACVRVCESSQPFVSGVLLSWLALCLYHFLCFCHSLSHCCSIPLPPPSPSPFLPTPPPPPPRCLDGGHEMRESRDQHREYRR